MIQVFVLIRAYENYNHIKQTQAKFSTVMERKGDT